MTNDNLPEAPASVTYSVTTAKGYPILFTLRETSGKDLLEKMDAVEKVFEEKGYKPQVRQGFAKKEVEYVEGKKCPQCGGRMIKKVSKTGKPFEKCENGRWNFQTKQAEGCPFVDWLEPKIEFNKQAPYADGDSIPIEEYENFDQHLASIKNE